MRRNNMDKEILKAKHSIDKNMDKLVKDDKKRDAKSEKEHKLLMKKNKKHK